MHLHCGMKVVLGQNSDYIPVNALPKTCSNKQKSALGGLAFNIHIQQSLAEDKFIKQIYKISQEVTHHEQSQKTDQTPPSAKRISNNSFISTRNKKSRRKKSLLFLRVKKLMLYSKHVIQYLHLWNCTKWIPEWVSGECFCTNSEILSSSLTKYNKTHNKNS